MMEDPGIPYACDNAVILKTVCNRCVANNESHIFFFSNVLLSFAFIKTCCSSEHLFVYSAYFVFVDLILVYTEVNAFVKLLFH